MEWYVAAGWNAQDVPNYDCRVVNRTIEEWLAMGRPSTILGVAFIIYGLIAEIIYVVVMKVLLKPEFLNLSCYKIMLTLGLYDMFAIGVNSLITGYFWLIGACYCVHPDFMYISGAIGLGLWCGACMTCFVLVINRIIDLWKPHIMIPLFGGKRTWFILTIPLMYSIYFTLFTEPFFFSSEKTAWFFDPFIIEGSAIEAIHNMPHTANNLLIVVSTCGLYGLLCYILVNKFKSATNKKISRLQKSKSVWLVLAAIPNTIGITQCMFIFGDIAFLKLKIYCWALNPKIFVQSTAICMANLVAALIYVYMQFFPTPDYFVLIGHLCWQAGHGIPAFVYIGMNQTIQREALQMIGIQPKQQKSVTTTSTIPI